MQHSKQFLNGCSNIWKPFLGSFPDRKRFTTDLLFSYTLKYWEEPSKELEKLKWRLIPDQNMNAAKNPGCCEYSSKQKGNALGCCRQLCYQSNIKWSTVLTWCMVPSISTGTMKSALLIGWKGRQGNQSTLKIISPEGNVRGMKVYLILRNQFVSITGYTDLPCVWVQHPQKSKLYTAVFTRSHAPKVPSIFGLHTVP